MASRDWGRRAYKTETAHTVPARERVIPTPQTYLPSLINLTRNISTVLALYSNVLKPLQRIRKRMRTTSEEEEHIGELCELRVAGLRVESNGLASFELRDRGR